MIKTHIQLSFLMPFWEKLLGTIVIKTMKVSGV